MVHIEGGQVGCEELVEEREWGLLRASTSGGFAVEISRVCLKQMVDEPPCVAKCVCCSDAESRSKGS
jgi:hypothetical protein